MRVIASDERRAPDIARASDIGWIGCTIRRRVYSRDIRLIIHRRSIDRSRVGGNARRVGGNARRDDDDLFIYLGDDGRRPRRLGRLGGDDGGERELGRERRGEHGVDRSFRSRCDDRSVRFDRSFRSVVSVVSVVSKEGEKSSGWNDDVRSRGKVGCVCVNRVYYYASSSSS